MVNVKGWFLGKWIDDNLAYCLGLVMVHRWYLQECAYLKAVLSSRSAKCGVLVVCALVLFWWQNTLYYFRYHYLYENQYKSCCLNGRPIHLP